MSADGFATPDALNELDAEFALPADPEVGADLSPMYGLPLSKYDWRRFLTYTTAPKPKLLSDKEYERLDAEARAEYDLAREAHHDRLRIIQTASMTRVHNQLARCLRRARNLGMEIKPGVLLSGDATMGKTTCAKMFARNYELELRSESPELFTQRGVDYTPVMIVKTPEPPSGRHGVTPLALALAMGRFLDVPLEHRPDLETLRPRILEAMRRCGTKLVIIDDFHNLEDTKGTGQAAVMFVKNLMESSGAAFCIIGVNMESSSLLEDEQTAGRLKLERYQRYDLAKPAERTDWQQLILSLEDALVLGGQKPQSLTRLYEYLHRRTGGGVGDLVGLLSEAAIAAVERAGRPSEEVIDVELLEEISTGAGAQLRYEQWRRKHKAAD